MIIGIVIICVTTFICFVTWLSFKYAFSYIDPNDEYLKNLKKEIKISYKRYLELNSRAYSKYFQGWDVEGEKLEKKATTYYNEYKELAIEKEKHLKKLMENNND